MSLDDEPEPVPGLPRLVFLLVAAALAIGIGWATLYVAYRFLGSGW